MCSQRHARAWGEPVIGRGACPPNNERALPKIGVERGSGSTRGGKAPYKRIGRNLIAGPDERATHPKRGLHIGLRSSWCEDTAAPKPDAVGPQHGLLRMLGAGAYALKPDAVGPHHGLLRILGAGAFCSFTLRVGSAWNFCPECLGSAKLKGAAVVRQSRKKGGAKRNERSGSRRRQMWE